MSTVITDRHVRERQAGEIITTRVRALVSVIG
jgi:hypothetical protein